VPSEDEPTAALTSRTAVIAALLLVGAIIVMVFVSQSGDDAEDGDAPAGGSGLVTAGVVAPDFTLTSLDGESVSLSDYAGRPVLLNFWASWCPPCREEFPALAVSREAHVESGFEILGVTHNDTDELSQKFADDANAEWPLLPDSDNTVWEAYGGVGLPTSYFVDAEGVVQRVHIGPVDEDQLADHLSAIGVPGDQTPSDNAA
jgi:peroxiredoxin